LLHDLLSIARSHRLRIMALGGLFGWLLSVPLFGPVLYTIVEAEASRLSVFFLASHATALLLLVWVLRRSTLFVQWGKVLSACLLACALAILPVYRYAPDVLSMLSVLYGMLAAMVIVCWWQWFIRTAQPGERGRVLALSMLLANLIFYFVGLLVEISPVVVVTAAVSALLLPLGAFRIGGDADTLARSTLESMDAVPGSTRILMTVCVFLVFTFSVGGIMYNYIYPHLETLVFGIFLEFAAYTSVVLLAGIVADNRGRRALPHFAVTGLGLGYLCFIFLSGTIQSIASTVFLQGGFGFLDLFAWVVLADLSAVLGIWAAFAGLGLMVGGILLGAVLTPSAVPWLDGIFPLIFLPLALLFMAVTVLWGLRETLPSPVQEGKDSNVTPLEAIVQIATVPLTPRELEIVELLYARKSTRVIEEELNISRNTLKTHLKNIYRKTDCGNRKELLYKMVSGNQS